MSDFTTWRSLVDGEEISAIPDSAIHHWPIDEGSGGTIEDVIGTHDADVNGPTWVSNDYRRQYALDGDGVDDYIDLGTLGDYGSEVVSTNDFAWVLTLEVDDPSSGDEILGARFAFTNVDRLHVQFRGDDEIRCLYGGDRNDFSIGPDLTVGKHRLVINRSGTGWDGWELYVNGEEQDGSNEGDSGETAEGDLQNDLYMMAKNSDAAEGHLDCVIDNVIFTDSALSESEIQDDYDLQPWS